MTTTPTKKHSARRKSGLDLIGFAENLSGEVITLTQGELAISDDLSIDASNLAQAPVIDADQKSRVMHFTADEGDLELTRLILRNGEVSSVDDARGGGILSASTGAVILSHSTLSGNFASSSGRGHDAFGGGICAPSGDIILTGSNLSGNSVSSLGYGGDAFGGGAFTRSGAITLTNSTVSGNSAIGDYEDGNAYGGGIYSFTGAITVTKSSLSKNHVSAYDSYGGAIFSNSGQVSLTDSKVNGNYAKGGRSGRSSIPRASPCSVSGSRRMLREAPSGFSNVPPTSSPSRKSTASMAPPTFYSKSSQLSSKPPTPE